MKKGLFFKHNTLFALSLFLLVFAGLTDQVVFGSAQETSGVKHIRVPQSQFTVIIHSSIDKSFDKPHVISVPISATIKNLRDAYASKTQAEEPSEIVIGHYGLGPWGARGSGMGRSPQNNDLKETLPLTSIDFKKLYLIAYYKTK